MLTYAALQSPQSFSTLLSLCCHGDIPHQFLKPDLDCQGRERCCYSWKKILHLMNMIRCTLLRWIPFFGQLGESGWLSGIFLDFKLGVLGLNPLKADTWIAFSVPVWFCGASLNQSTPGFSSQTYKLIFFFVVFSPRTPRDRTILLLIGLYSD